ncbi:MAG TPA: FecR domain-containing protein [Pyrinomonadaceae bacterium]|nr:FecR domain-containing protein [Pyrinomonadaceae bacterium]
MKRNRKELDSILDRVAAGVRSEEPDAATVGRAADRVWARIQREGAVAELPETVKPAEEIRGCADFQSLIPAYLRKELSEARMLLVEDHTRECIPCRKALKAARTGGAQAAPAVRPAAKVGGATPQMPVWKWAIAATLLVGLSVVVYNVYQRIGIDARATVEIASGAVYKVTDAESRALGVGDEIRSGEIVRTTKDSGAVVKLEDGSTVEMRERSEFSLSRNADGTTIHLNRGNVIVEAAKQRGGHLYVATPDALVSVTGTIFSVNNGTKGSRVSVVEGEVHVTHAGDEKVLRPGDQATTSPSLEAVPIQEEIAWSRNAERYGRLVTELTSLKRELDQKAPRPGVRYSTRLLDLTPEGTVLYAALPNLTATLVESHRIMRERIRQNAALQEWWAEEKPDQNPGLDQLIEEVNQFGKYLGTEIAASAKMGDRGPEDPLVLAELADAPGFRAYLEQKIASFTTAEKNAPRIRIIDDPATAAQAGDGRQMKEILVWINNDLMAAAPRLQQLQQLSAALKGENNFKTSAFYARLAETYKAGAGLIVAADLEKIIGRMVNEGTTPEAAKRYETYRKLGLTSLKHFVAEQKDAEGKTNSRATVSFKGQRTGIASWLAAPGPMGALSFISPDANMVAAFVVREPASLVDELLGYLDTAAPRMRQHLQEHERAHDLKLREDFAAPLGGEFAFALDGPVLPTPSWKMVFEVYDQARLQQTFERVVEEVNKQAAKVGVGGLVWERGESGGHTFYALKSTAFGVEVHYTYASGYLVAGPSRAMVERALKYRESGYTLLRSPRFTSTLPADGQVNFSAIFYHDLAPLLEPVSGHLERAAKEMTEEQQRAIKATAEAPPTLAYAYAQGDALVFAADSDGGPFGLSTATLMGLPSSFEMQHILHSAMRGGEKK